MAVAIPLKITTGEVQQWASSDFLALSQGGTSAALTASNGGIVYSTASALAILAAGSSGQILRSGGAGAPTWSTATFPATATPAGAYLRADGTNWITSTLILPNSATANYFPYVSATNTMSFTSALQYNGTTFAMGNGTFSSSYLLNLENSVNGLVGFRVRNSSTGTAAVGGFSVSNDSTTANFAVFSTTYISSGLNIQNSLLISKAGSAAQINIAATDAAGMIRLITGGSSTSNERWRVSSSGYLSNTQADGTAWIHVKAVSSSASSAPIKLTLGGTLMTTPEPGAIEAINTHIYWTSSAGVRYQLDQQNTIAPAYPFMTKTANYSIAASDKVIEVTATINTTQTLPSAVGIAGQEFTIINAGTAVVTVATTSSQTIGNASTGNPTTFTLNSTEWITVISNGTNYRVV